RFNGLKKLLGNLLGVSLEVAEADIAGLEESHDAVGVAELDLTAAEANAVEATEDAEDKRAKPLEEVLHDGSRERVCRVFYHSERSGVFLLVAAMPALFKNPVPRKR